MAELGAAFIITAEDRAHPTTPSLPAAICRVAVFLLCGLRRNIQVAVSATKIPRAWEKRGGELKNARILWIQKKKWLGRLASNQGPRDPKSRALPTAPRPSGKEIYNTLCRFCEGIEIGFGRVRLLPSRLSACLQWLRTMNSLAMRSPLSPKRRSSSSASDSSNSRCFA